MRTLGRTLSLIISIILFTQCRMSECSVVMTDVDINGWSEEASVSYVNSEESSNYDLSITLHVNRRFTAKRLELEVTTMTPDSLRYSEQVSLPINFSWDSITTATKDIDIPYRQEVNLRCEGEYKLVITPQQSVVGVEAVGVNFQTKR